jgi:hypothetical protein
MTRVLLAIVLAGVGALPARAQDVRTQPHVVVRARQLAGEGKVGEGRRLIDSVLRVTPTDSALYADALYWRASNAATAADAERDYRRLLIEAPLSSRAEDALLRLAELQESRGDRRGASEHLQRFLLSYAKHAERPRVALSLVRLLFEQGPQQTARACEVWRVARDEVPPGNAEMRNQLDYYASRCAFAEAQTPVPSDPAPPPAPADTAPRRTPPRATVSRSGSGPFYSVQVAAYDSPEPAERLKTLLASRGIEARVDGRARPYRVRVGRYATRAEAARAAARLKSQGHNGFIALVPSR